MTSSEAGAGTGAEAGRLGERLSLREQVVRAVRAALVAGEMRPGTVYSAPTLAMRFGVSATPVREALLDLAKDGLVEAVRNKGFRVRSLSPHDFDEIYRLRELLEVPTVAGLARECPPGLLPRLRALADEVGAAVGRGDVLAYLDADHRFHTGLLQGSGNQRLVRIVADLWAQARLYSLGPLVQQGRLADAGLEHHRLLDLVEAGDAEGAAGLTREHLAWSRRLTDVPGEDPA